ncbi:odorant receptor 4 isoform X2 [Monomorium pharaonis]|uniref:odorant receptor 4 isoform X2 n=1 Tax=Monomorium pharaonis TaxID=307658 RepID=UPI00063F59B0|nr:odorant receptor 4 isoform X2 [Monomorium pharaonis]
MQSPDLVRASNIVTWNKWFLNFLGLCPTKVNQPVFVVVIVYMVLHCIIAANHLIRNINHPDLVVANLTDNVFISMILGKMSLCRWNSKIMAKFLKSIEADFTTEMYGNVREKMAYLYYNEIALIFVKVSMFMTGFTASIYFFWKIFVNWSAGNLESNFTNSLPYPVHPFFEIKDITTYICVSFYLGIMLPVILCGYGGPDAYVLSMSFHICGQFAALSCKIDNLLRDHKNYHRHISNIILRHRHLIRLAQIVENNFNMMYLQQTVCSVFLLCLTLYHMMAKSDYEENSKIALYALYTFCVSGTILTYCYTGECLLTESVKLRETFYNTDWYNISPSYAKLIGICLIRSERPMILTAGKFCVLSLNTFTSIVKTSMAYLSVLRNFM